MATPLPASQQPLPWGKPSPHILKSAGADPDLYCFYSSSYSTSYGLKDYRPRDGSHHGTGYKSNIRPQFSYSRQLDEHDNPPIARLLADQYDTVTKKSYRPNTVPHGREPLPLLMNDNVGTGFTREKPLTIPTQAQVYAPFTRSADAGSHALPKYQPHLHKMKAKTDPVEAHDGGRGPNYMDTEYKTIYHNKNNMPRDIFPRNTGDLCDTGFTSNKNIEPVTFHHDMPYKDPQFNDRPVGSSEYHHRYREKEVPTGAEALPYSLPGGASADTGFTREEDHPRYKPKDQFLTYANMMQLHPNVARKLAKNDPAAFISVAHPDNKTSTVPHFYQGKQTADPTEAQRLNRAATGNLTDTGFSENTTILLPETLKHAEDDPKRFLTHNNLQYYDKNPTGKHREGRVFGAVQPHTEDGFTKSEKTHKLGTGERWDPSQQLRSQNPYQAASIKARDKFFDDHTHDHKMAGYTLPEADKGTALKPSMNIQKPRLMPYERDPVFTGARVGTAPNERHMNHWAAAQYQAAPAALP